MNLFPYGGESIAVIMLNYCPGGSALKLYFPNHLPRICCLSRKHNFASYGNRVHQQFESSSLSLPFWGCGGSVFPAVPLVLEPLRVPTAIWVRSDLLPVSESSVSPTCKSDLTAALLCALLPPASLHSYRSSSLTQGIHNTFDLTWRLFASCVCASFRSCRGWERGKKWL